MDDWMCRGGSEWLPNRQSKNRILDATHVILHLEESLPIKSFPCFLYDFFKPHKVRILDPFLELFESQLSNFKGLQYNIVDEGRAFLVPFRCHFSVSNKYS